MKIKILTLLIIMSSSIHAMEPRRRLNHPKPQCISCVSSTELSEDGTKKKMLDEIKRNEDAHSFKSRVFSEANQKENPTPVATILVDSFAICCSGMLMLWSEYEKNK